MNDYPGRLIQAGEKDAAIVLAVQARLNEAGCGPVPATGVFGPKTVAAVKLFQSTRRDHLGNPLEIDGKIGAITWTALFGASAPPAPPPSDSLASKVLAVATSQVGVLEDPPGSNRGARVGAYLHSVGLEPGYFWCAAFVYWCFQEASVALGRANPVFRTAGCMNHWNGTKARRIVAANAVANPALVKPGQIFIINHGRGTGHTGLVERVEAGFLQTIEGNSDPEGGSNGIGVFRLQRKIAKINQGFIEYT